MHDKTFFVQEMAPQSKFFLTIRVNLGWRITIKENNLKRICNFDNNKKKILYKLLNKKLNPILMNI